MSVKHPIISITGSSGAGTSSVKQTFEQIFRRERIEVAARGDVRRAKLYYLRGRVGKRARVAEK